MGSRDYLGELEQLVLLALMRLGDDAYGVSIRRELEHRTGRGVTLGSIYPTLHRLEAKGLVSSFKSEPRAARGGRARRCFRLEPEGSEALRKSREVYEAMWDGVQPEAGSKP